MKSGAGHFEGISLQSKKTVIRKLLILMLTGFILLAVSLSGTTQISATAPPYERATEGFERTGPGGADLSCGSLVSDTISAAAEVDQYTFVGQANDRVTLTLGAGGFPNFVTATATVFSPTAAVVVTFNANSQQQLVLPETGTYVIQVRASNFVSTGSYSLGLECLIPTSPVDSALACGSLFASSISASAEVDQLTFIGQMNDRVTLTLGAGGFPNFVTATATVFSPTAVQVISFNANSQQQLVLPEFGTYVIQVRASNFVSTGSYSLGLECLLPTNPVDATLGCGTLLSSRPINASAQVDQLTFIGQANDRVTLTLGAGGFPNFVTATATVFSPTAVQVALFNANGQQQLTLPETGTYVIQVRANNFVSTGSYSLGRACPVLTPVIGSFSPTGGLAGTTVTITGLNLNGATQVRFNGLSASFTVDSPSQITATVPTGATTGPISVQTPSGTAVSASAFVVGAARITVNSNLDNIIRDNLLTLREAIRVANGMLMKAALTPAEQALVVGAPTGPSLDEIRFNIGSGPQTIDLTSALDTITGPVVINGTTQPGFIDKPIIELNGTNAGPGVSGLRIAAGGSTVRGLVINRFSGDGILLQSAGGNLIAGNFIGTSIDGNVDQGNGGHGVSLLNVSNNVIGGTSPSERNVISGNAMRGVSIIGDQNKVQGNLIGTGQDGTTALGNDLDGVSFFGKDNTIGARLNLDQTLSGLGNTIAFNRTGVQGSEDATGGKSTGNSIVSNLIFSNQLAQIKLQASCPASDCTAPPPANNGQAPPALDSVNYDESTGTLTITGTLAAAPSTDYFLQFFSFDMCLNGTPSGNPQSITSLPILRRTDSSGRSSFTVVIQVASLTGGFVNATATDPQNNTSPFSPCAQINGNCAYFLTPQGLSYPAGGGMNSVAVTAGAGCQWTAVSNNPDFITITSGMSGSGMGTVLYTVAANATASPRSGTMTIAGQTFTVDQNAQSCTFSVAPPAQNFTLEGGPGIVTVTAGAGCQWTAVSNNPDFITIISPASGSGSSNGSVSYQVGASTGSARTGTITIAGQTFTVTQETGCSFFIDHTNRSFSASAATSSINVTAGEGCDWTAVSNSPGFITITSGSPGTGNGTVAYSITANTTTSPRNGTITVAGQTYTVFQGAQFNDVPLNHPFYTEIGKLSSRGVTLGCGAGVYCPDDIVTRQQMAAFIIRARGELNPPFPASQRFPDVTPNNTFYAFIDRMAVLGITLGCGGGNYCPLDPVTRDQMAAFMIRGLSVFDPPVPPTQRFPDVPPTNVFYNFIEEMAVRQITLGCGGGNYCPSLAVTRGQMAAFLVRAFNL